MGDGGWSCCSASAGRPSEHHLPKDILQAQWSWEESYKSHEIAAVISGAVISAHGRVQHRDQAALQQKGPFCSAEDQATVPGSGTAHTDVLQDPAPAKGTAKARPCSGGIKLLHGLRVFLKE